MIRTRFRVLLGITAAAIAASGAVAEAQAGSFTATFAKTSDWGTGFVAHYTLRNATGSAIHGWRLEFDAPQGAAVTTAWNGVMTKSGNHYTITDESWTHDIASGSSAEIGFEGTYTGPWKDFLNCTLNGAPCSGGPAPAPDTAAPTAPGGLKITGTTSSSVSLAWTASTDNIGVAGYRVYRNGTQAAQASQTSATIGGLPASTSSSFTVRAYDAAGNVSDAGAAVTGTTTAAPAPNPSPTPQPPVAGPRVAPYADMTLWPPFDLSAASAATDLKAYTMAFVVDGGGCKASWGGVLPVSQKPFADQVSAFRAKGGEVIVSFGGAAGQELAQTCASVPDLVTQYQSVIDTYMATSIDFDVEGGAVAQPTSIERRSQALAILQRNAATAGRKLTVSLTLPVLPTGLTQDGINVVRSAINAGVRLDVVNVMAMDYGDWAAPSPAGKMGTYAIQSGQSTHDQLATLLPSATDAQLWSMIGVTPMIGVNDVQSEVFTLSDADQVTQWASQKHIGRLSFWSANRDKQCNGGAKTYADPSCSSIVQSDGAFSRAFGAFNG